MLRAKCAFIAPLAAGLALAACAGSRPPEVAAADGVTAPTIGQRELTPQEKKVIIDAIAPSIRDAASAKYRWPQFPMTVAGDVNYCAMVNAKSPYPAYSGLQAYIVNTKVVGGRISSAVVGLIAGGKDKVLVSRMCAKYGLDPNEAS